MTTCLHDQIQKHLESLGATVHAAQSDTPPYYQRFVDMSPTSPVYIGVGASPHNALIQAARNALVSANPAQLVDLELLTAATAEFNRWLGACTQSQMTTQSRGDHLNPALRKKDPRKGSRIKSQRTAARSLANALGEVGVDDIRLQAVDQFGSELCTKPRWLPWCMPNTEGKCVRCGL